MSVWPRQPHAQKASHRLRSLSVAIQLMGHNQALELFWALAQMQRRDSPSQISVLYIGESNATHEIGQFPLIGKSRHRIRQILICAS